MIILKKKLLVECDITESQFGFNELFEGADKEKLVRICGTPSAVIVNQAWIDERDPAKMEADEKRSYRPSSGTEGDWFEEKFCALCRYWTEEAGCPIQLLSMIHNEDEFEYPKCWQYDSENKPTCTMFYKK